MFMIYMKLKMALFNCPDESLQIKTKRPFLAVGKMPKYYMSYHDVKLQKGFIMMYTVIVAAGENVRMVKVEAEDTKAARAKVENAIVGG